jgi:PAS domain S-box-containing protein
LVQRAIDRAAIDKETIDLEHRLLMPDGSVKHLHVVGHALPDESEKLQFAGAVMDITERKTAEKELRRSEQRYRHLFHHMPVALWQLNASRLLELFQQLRSEDVADLEAYFDTHPGLVQRCMEMLIVEEVNEHTVKMLGRRDPSEFVGTTIADYFPRNSPTFRRSMVSRYRGDPNYAAETKLFALDGRVIDVLYTASRVGSISEPGMSLLGVIDISERKQAEEALRWSEQRYRLLFDNLPVALWQLDAQPLVAMLRDLRAQGVNDLSAYIDDHPDFLPNVIGAQKFEEVNDYAVQLFGARDRNELLGTSPWAWLKSHDTLRRAVESRWRGEEFYQETTKLVTRDGRTIDALFATARPQTTEGLPITFVGVIDLTKQVRAEEELQRLQADFAHAARISMLGELTASIAHEVNQPLASIAAGGEASLRWLTRPTPNVEEVRELTRQMVADARRASKIVDRVRAMASRRAPEQMLLSLDDVIREALRFLRHELESRNVAALHFPALSSPKVFADRTQLQQVIVNLVVNAMQAIAQAGSRNRNIVIRTVADDFATLHCSVEDSGPGIEPQHIARLFDSFFTTKDGGMGMGLRICRSVIEAHGGCIGADNECSQGGARFFFTLPVAGTIE